MLDLLLVLVVLVGVVAVVGAPLRRAAVEREPNPALLDLEARKLAKYAEIRDAELDLRTGKLSEEDFDSLNAGLRAEAVEILQAIDAVSASGGERSSLRF